MLARKGFHVRMMRNVLEEEGYRENVKLGIYPALK